MKLISVIVPAYNAENTLYKCIESIMNQTYKNLDIIIVDDGSTDNTKEIINKCISKDKRVRCMSQSNAGAAIARNNGLNIARGQYITFIDSDDYIADDLIFRLVEGAQNTNSDLIISTLVNNVQSYPFEDNKSRLINRKEFGLYFQKLYLTYCLNSLCGNLYRADIAKQCKFITSLRVGEDLTFNFQYILRSNSIFLIPYRGYYYINNVFSSTHRYNIDDFTNQEEIIKLANEFCDKMGIRDFIEAVDIMYLRNVIDVIVNTVTYAPTQEAYCIIKKFRESNPFKVLINKYSASNLGLDSRRNFIINLYEKKMFLTMVTFGKINYIRNEIKKQKTITKFKRYH